MVEIRPARPCDDDAVGGVLVGAFAEEGPQLVALLAALAEAGRLQVSLVADLAGEVVGQVVLSRAWVDAEERLVEAMVLGPLGVLPGHQGRGTGTALVSAALHAAEEAGSPLVCLEGDPGYYARRGFERASRHGLLRPSARIPDAACQVALLPAYEPWMRGRLVYCDPFWALDCVGLRGATLAQARASLGD